MGKSSLIFLISYILFPNLLQNYYFSATWANVRAKNYKKGATSLPLLYSDSPLPVSLFGLIKRNLEFNRLILTSELFQEIKLAFI